MATKGTVCARAPVLTAGACKSYWNGCAKVATISFWYIFFDFGAFHSPFTFAFLKRLQFKTVLFVALARRRAEMIWVWAEESWDEVRRAEVSVRRAWKMRRHDLRRAEKSCEKSWYKPRWDQMGWVETTWHEKSGDELSWDELRRMERLRRAENRRVHMSWEEMWKAQLTWKEMRTVVISWEELRKGGEAWDELRWDEKNEKTRHEMRWAGMTQTAVTMGCNEQFPREAAMRWDQTKWEKILEKRWRRNEKSKDCCCEAQKACPHPIGAQSLFHSIGYRRFFWNFGPPACPGTTCIGTTSSKFIVSSQQFNRSSTWARVGPGLGQDGSNLGPTWTHLAPTWAQLGPNVAQLGRKLTLFGNNFGPSWAPGGLMGDLTHAHTHTMQNAEYVRFHWYFVCFGVGLCSAQCSPSVLGSCAQHGFNVGSTWVDWGSSGPCWAQHEPILPTQWDMLKTRVFGAISHVWAIFHRLGLCWAQLWLQRLKFRQVRPSRSMFGST